MIFLTAPFLKCCHKGPQRHITSKRHKNAENHKSAPASTTRTPRTPANKHHQNTPASTARTPRTARALQQAPREYQEPQEHTPQEHQQERQEQQEPQQTRTSAAKNHSKREPQEHQEHQQTSTTRTAQQAPREHREPQEHPSKRITGAQPPPQNAPSPLRVQRVRAGRNRIYIDIKDGCQPIGRGTRWFRPGRVLGRTPGCPTCESVPSITRRECKVTALAVPTPPNPGELLGRRPTPKPKRSPRDL